MSNIARDGAPKRSQVAFAPANLMRDLTDELSGVSPANPGVGPDASTGNPLEAEPLVKEIDDITDTPWGQTDADGDTLDCEIGDCVMDEATYTR